MFEDVRPPSPQRLAVPSAKVIWLHLQASLCISCSGDIPALRAARHQHLCPARSSCIRKHRPVRSWWSLCMCSCRIQALLRLPVPSAAERARSMCAEDPALLGFRRFSLLFCSATGQKQKSQLGHVWVTLVQRSDQEECGGCFWLPRRKAMRPTKNAVRASHHAKGLMPCTIVRTRHGSSRRRRHT